MLLLMFVDVASSWRAASLRAFLLKSFYFD